MYPWPLSPRLGLCASTPGRQPHNARGRIRAREVRRRHRLWGVGTRSCPALGEELGERQQEWLEGAEAAARGPGGTRGGGRGHGQSWHRGWNNRWDLAYEIHNGACGGDQSNSGHGGCSSAGWTCGNWTWTRYTDDSGRQRPPAVLEEDLGETGGG